MSKTMSVLVVIAFVALAAVLIGQGQDDPECTQWRVRSSPLGEVGESAPQEELAEAGWEPFAGSVRDERVAGQVGRIRVRPHVFLRRCVAWSP